MCSTDGSCNNDGTGVGTDVDANCPAIHFTPKPVIPSIELVLDRSGSMTTTDIGGMQRFVALENALFDATNGAIVKSQAQVYFGEMLYAGDQPNCNDGNPGSLGVNGFTAPRALNNASVMSTLTMNKPPNGGGTPTGAAIDTAATDFATNPPPAGSPAIMLLATDGQPNACNSNATNDGGRTVDAVTRAFGNHISTFVIGLQLNDGNAKAYLQSVANAGVGQTMGNAPYYLANNPQSLVDAFNQIISGAISCDLTINMPVDPASAPGATVTLDGTNLTYGTDWSLDADNMTIHILGASCTALKTTPNAVVEAVFPCGSVIL
ncbi:MAG TPA: vWA domain-containing protein [Kofleriaceae bacterium]